MSEQINQFAKFQSTLPRRSDDTYGGDCSYTYGFQSTLPRRSDYQSRGRCTYGGYFNPRSREGATAFGVWSAVYTVDFNPRSREGATFPMAHLILLYTISIHAPAKERPQYGAFATALRDFNPRSREGATKETVELVRNVIFQSTLPRRSDHPM